MNTHQVFNQATELFPYNLYDADPVLQTVVQCFKGDWANDQLRAYGAEIGAMFDVGVAANRYPPELQTHDRFGERIDRVNYHPAYHALMTLALRYRLPSLPWEQQRAGAQVARAALCYLHHQIESGTGCPLTMTYASFASLQHNQRLYNELKPLLCTDVYDPTFAPYSHKKAITIGMAMTEKQGGSDVRANTTIAKQIDPNRDDYELTGHKWFCSAPMSDGFLTLAQAKQGISCFFMPRWRPDGNLNGMQIMRLKDKLGNRSNASSEIELTNAYAILIGEEGRGIPAIIDMVAHTRFDCMVGSAALMRQAVFQAVHHCSERAAFNKKLITQPLMENVLADLILESEAALWFAMRTAQALEHAEPKEKLLARILAPIGKYYICKRALSVVSEASECLGGAGYVEETLLPRLYREAPVNSIWEGSGNMQCLDVLRILHKQPEVFAALWDELDHAMHQVASFDKARIELEQWLDQQAPTDLEFSARLLIEQLACLMQAALLIRHAPPIVAAAYCDSRLAQKHHSFSGLREKQAVEVLLGRAHKKIQ